MSLTPEQVTIIKATVPVVKEHGNAITSSFYDTLFKELPQLTNLFNQANQARGRQQAVLATALYAYAANIDNLGVLLPAVEKICQKHTSLYVQPEQYAVVGEYLLRAMSDILQAAFTPEIRDAWAAAYWQLANLMIKRESEIYETVGETQWTEFKIVDKVQESDVITSFHLQPIDGRKLPKALPGQFITVLVDDSQPRHYTLSDIVNGDSYRISVKRENGVNSENPNGSPSGLISNMLHDRPVGSTIKISHPSGVFFLDPDTDINRPIVLIAAGVGITPMMAILNTLVVRGSKQPISFIHGSNNRQVRAFATHIRLLKQEAPNIQYTSFITVENGYHGEAEEFGGHIDLWKLDPSKDLCLHSKDTLYFVCGPEGFMVDVASGLKKLGVVEERIKFESFKPSL